MPSNAGNVGVDYSVLFYDGNTGALQDLGDVQNVKFTAQKHDVANRPYNAAPKFDYIPDGHKVTFTITRTTSALESLMITKEARFNQGIGNIAGFLNKTVTDFGPVVHVFQYRSFVFFIPDLGDVSREKLVTLAAEGMASDEIQLS